MSRMPIPNGAFRNRLCPECMNDLEMLGFFDEPRKRHNAARRVRTLRQK